MTTIAQLPQFVALQSGGNTMAFQNTGSSFEVVLRQSDFAMVDCMASLGSSLTPGEKLGQRFISLHGHSPNNVTHFHNHAARRFIRDKDNNGQLFAKELSPSSAVTKLLSVGEVAPSVVTGNSPSIPIVPLGSEESDGRLTYTQQYVRLGPSAFMTTDNTINALFGNGAGEDVSYVKIYGTTTALRNYLQRLDELSGTQLDTAYADTLNAMMTKIHDYISELIRNRQEFAFVPYTMREIPVSDDSPFKQISFGINGFFLDVNHPDGILHMNIEIKPGQEEEAKRILLQLFEK